MSKYLGARRFGQNRTTIKSTLDEDLQAFSRSEEAAWRIAQKGDPAWGIPEWGIQGRGIPAWGIHSRGNSRPCTKVKI
jgi:hypothetical protein